MTNQEKILSSIRNGGILFKTDNVTEYSQSTVMDYVNSLNSKGLEEFLFRLCEIEPEIKYVVDCPTCHGMKFSFLDGIERSEICKDCKGTGKISIEPENDFGMRNKNQVYYFKELQNDIPVVTYNKDEITIFHNQKECLLIVDLLNVVNKQKDCSFVIDYKFCHEYVIKCEEIKEKPFTIEDIKKAWLDGQKQGYIGTNLSWYISKL